MKNHKLAILDFSKYIVINPNNVDAYYRAIEYIKLKKYDLAKNDLSNVIIINSNNADAYYIRGLIKWLSKDNDNGKMDLNIAKELYLKNNQFDLYDKCIRYIKY